MTLQPVPAAPRQPPRAPRSPVVGIAAACALAGCAGGAPHGARPADAQPAQAESGAPAFVSPARWVYHPTPPDTATAWVRLQDGGCVLVAEGGQRWVVGPGRARARQGAAGQGGAAGAPCAGRAQASSAIAPEELVDIVRRSADTRGTGSGQAGPAPRTAVDTRGSGSGQAGPAPRTPSAWLFVGASGTIYEAATPLGPFGRAVEPPEPLAKIAGAGGALIAVTRDGKLLRWEEGGSWKAAALDAAGAPAPPRVVDVAVGAGGKALALAVPEALFASTDGGSSWARAPVAPMGLSRVGALEGGELAAQGVLASLAWGPGQAPAFARTNAALPAAQADVDLDVGRAPSAGAVRVGRAVIAGDRYYEALRPEDPGEDWSLAGGPVEGPLVTRPLPNTSECGSVKLGAGARGIALVCVRMVGDAILAEVRRSEDGGSRWSTAAKLETPDVDRIGVAVAPDGAALLTGVCRQGDTAAACDPGAPILLRPEGDAVAVTLASAPTLDGAATLPAFSADGRAAYFAGYRAKDDRLALFVSHDGGETFAPRTLQRVVAAAAPRADRAREEEEEEEEVEEEGRRGRREGSESFDLVEDSTLRPGEDGVVGLLLAMDGAPAYVTTDDDGRILGVAEPPADGAVMAGFGRRVLALGPAPAQGGVDPERAAIWESLDGGQGWAELPAMPALSSELARGSAQLACGAAACLIGDTVTRVGWGGQAEPAPAAADGPPPRRDPAVRTPIVCELAAASKWTRIDHVDGDAWGLPTANEVMRGRSIWSVLTRDPKGAVGVTAAMLPESGAGEAKIFTRVLLPAVPRGARAATHVATQMEGYAVARVRLPGSAPGELAPGTPLRNVEIAWENYMDGTSGRAVLPDAGPSDVGDVTHGGETYDPALLSVSLRGVFIRPHALGTATFFLEPGGKQQRFDYPVWPAAGVAGRLDVFGDAVMADGRPVATGMIRLGSGTWTALLLAHRPAPGGPWEIAPVTVSPPAWEGRDVIAHVDWTYAGGVIGVTTLAADPRAGRAWATFQAFRGDGTLGPAQPLPTPFDVGDAPRPCSAAERKATARMEAPLFVRGEALFPGTRHPVLVADAAAAGAQVEPVVLLTSGVVLHGTPAAPCVAGWEANGLGRAPIAAILPADLGGAWLLRRATSPPAEGSIEARPMTCRFDAGARFPETVWTEPGTVRIER